MKISFIFARREFSIIAMFFVTLFLSILALLEIVEVPKNVNILYYSNVVFLVLGLFVVHQDSTKYVPCPSCNKSMLVKTDWQCPYCYHSQGFSRPIYRKCVNCQREIETIFCEHCNQELKIERIL